MFEYFKLLESQFDTIDMSILDLTRELMKSGEYYRGIYTFNNGIMRERTMYSKPFDSILVAKWICYYKNLFISKLIKHPELSDYHVDIINKTFYMVMTSLQLDKLVSDNVVNKYINLTLISRIREFMYYSKSRYSFDKYERGKALQYRLKGALDNQAISIDQFKDDYKYDILGYDQYSLEIDDFTLDVYNRLHNDYLGNKLYYAMLNSNTKFNLHDIDLKLGLPRKLCNKKTKELIAKMYNILKELTLDYSNSNLRQRFRKVSPNSVTYSFER